MKVTVSGNKMTILDDDNKQQKATIAPANSEPAITPSLPDAKAYTSIISTND